MKRHRLAIVLLVGGPIMAAATAYLQCYVRGNCSGSCIATGYDVTAVCWALAFKTWLAVLGALSLGLGTWCYLNRHRQ